MPRIARIVAVGSPHHITQRGNNKQEVFMDDEDRTKYLSLMDKYANKNELSILAYCLMNNHVHFVAIPNKEDSLSKTFKNVHMRYAQYFNKKTESTGHLWQGRFYSCILDEKHFAAAIRYVERNPVRANTVKDPCEWRWSSALTHVHKGDTILKLKDIFEFLDISKEKWGNFIAMEDNNVELKNIRKHTLIGRPLYAGSGKTLE